MISASMPWLLKMPCLRATRKVGFVLISAILIFRVSGVPLPSPAEAAASPLELQPESTSTRNKDKSRRLKLYLDFVTRTHLFVYEFLKPA